MIISIKLSNFLSFKNEAIFSFASPKNEMDTERTSVIWKYSLNKTNIIYWANASGKSNLLKGIQFIKKMILFSHDQNYPASKLWYKRFLLCEDEANALSTFEVAFAINNDIYKYSFSIEQATDNIAQESLILYTSQKPTKLFERKWNMVKTSKFSEWETKKGNIRKNWLALSTFSNLWWELSGKIREYFDKQVHIFWQDDTIVPIDTHNMFMAHPIEFKLFVKKLLNSADLSISDIIQKSEKKSLREVHPNSQPVPLGLNLDSMVDVVAIKLQHDVYADWKLTGKVEFDIDQESKGTNRLIDLSGSFFHILKNNMTLFVDELDSSLHPLLVKEIVRLFNSSKNTGSQLVFNCHDISLINEWILNRDQIRFVDKDKFWGSSLYSLNDFKWLSSIKNLEQAYLQWRFDAIPAITPIEV